MVAKMLNQLTLAIFSLISATAFAANQQDLAILAKISKPAVASPGLDFSNADLRSYKFNDTLNLKNANLSHANLQNVDLRRFQRTHKIHFASIKR